ncbi:S41 family peptidase [Haliangium sp.]|uniref:S41 family peptidase n=1 Tax=Haliangium sp. TaxID=2663208 RepID=UPI003D137F12
MGRSPPHRRPRRARRLLVSVALALVLVGAGGATAAPTQGAAGGPLTIERLARVGALWGQVKYLHPALAYRDLDWDQAFVSAVPAIMAAGDRAEYVAAVRDMLAVLGDPETTVEVAGVSAAKIPAELRWAGADGKVLVVDLGSADSDDLLSALAAVLSEIPKARAVIFDLRQVAPTSAETLAFLMSTWQRALAATELELPSHRYRLSAGYRPQRGYTSGGYYAALLTEQAEVVTPASNLAPARVVFMIGQTSVIPALAVAMQDSGQGAVVATEPVRTTNLAHTISVDLGEGVTVRLRVSDLVYRGRRVDVRADRVVRPAAVWPVALRLAGQRPRPRRAHARARPPMPVITWRPDRDYPNMTLPPLPYRLLAAVRLWSVIEHFYPYHHLIDDWGPVLAEFLPRFRDAADPGDYARAVLAMSARVADGHTRVKGGQVDEILGVAPPPFAVRVIEGRPVIVDLYDPDAAGGAAVGDVIESVDGVPMSERMAALRPYVTGATAANRATRLATVALRGPDGSQAHIVVRGVDAIRDLRVRRDRRWPKRWREQRMREPTFWRIEPDIGYVDLDRLGYGEVDAMFEAFRDTRAIIFDMRGYPNATAWAIAPRLTDDPGPVWAAHFERVMVSGSGQDYERRMVFRQALPPSQGWTYRGQTLMLIDETTQSQAEHTGLFLEAANDTRFVGTPSSGSNGDVTNLVLPGGITVFFTGHDVRHADGRQLQRIGLIPHIHQAPTIAGLRAGRDEVLARALDHLRGWGRASGFGERLRRRLLGRP